VRSGGRFLTLVHFRCSGFHFCVVLLPLVFSLDNFAFASSLRSDRPTHTREACSVVRSVAGERQFFLFGSCLPSIPTGLISSCSQDRGIWLGVSVRQQNASVISGLAHEALRAGPLLLVAMRSFAFLLALCPVCLRFTEPRRHLFPIVAGLITSSR
jgi:hypothetical protein